MLWKKMRKTNTEDLSVMKHFMSSYGWVEHKTQGVINPNRVPDQICEDFDDDCQAIPQSYWSCWEHDIECGVCPFALQEVSEEIEKIENR